MHSTTDMPCRWLSGRGLFVNLGIANQTLLTCTYPTGNLGTFLELLSRLFQWDIRQMHERYEAVKMVRNGSHHSRVLDGENFHLHNRQAWRKEQGDHIMQTGQYQFDRLATEWDNSTYCMHVREINQHMSHIIPHRISRQLHIDLRLPATAQIELTQRCFPWSTQY